MQISDILANPKLAVEKIKSQALQHLRPGQQVSAQVIEPTRQSMAKLRIGNQEIPVKTQLPLQQGTKLDLRVEKVDRQFEFSLIRPSSDKTVQEQSLRDHLPRQQPLVKAINQLMNAIERNAGKGPSVELPPRIRNTPQQQVLPPETQAPLHIPKGQQPLPEGLRQVLQQQLIRFAETTSATNLPKTSETGAKVTPQAPDNGRMLLQTTPEQLSRVPVGSRTTTESPSLMNTLWNTRAISSEQTIYLEHSRSQSLLTGEQTTTLNTAQRRLIQQLATPTGGAASLTIPGKTGVSLVASGPQNTGLPDTMVASTSTALLTTLKSVPAETLSRLFASFPIQTADAVKSILNPLQHFPATLTAGSGFVVGNKENLSTTLPLQQPVGVARDGSTSSTSNPLPLPEKLLQQVVDVVNQARVGEKGLNGEQVRQAFDQSGLFLEAKLAANHPPQIDMKSSLLRLLFTLKSTFGEMGQHFDSVTRQHPSPSETSGQQQQLLRLMGELQNTTESALSRIHVNQLASLPTHDGDSRQIWQFELPIQHQEQTHGFQMRIEHGGKGVGAGHEALWSVLIRFDIEPLGSISARIGLTGDEVSTHFIAQQDESTQRIESALPLLNSALQRAGLNVKNLTVRTGEVEQIPAHPRQGSHILDEKA